MGDTDESVLFELRHASGRTLRCSEYRVAWAYAGTLAGRPDAEWIMRTAVRRVRHYHGDHVGVHVVRPRLGAADRLPSVEIAAMLESDSLRDDADYSALVVIWYQDRPEPVPDACAGPELARLDWDALARDQWF